jgi:CheY-like chemotaxis protein
MRAAAQGSPAAAAASQPVRTAAPKPNAPAPQRLAVLIVEDDGFQQKLIGRLMNGLDIDVLFAGTGAEALDQMWEHKPDLVLMDVGLPDTNGVEATRKIKSIGQFGHVPILMVTGHSERNIVVESLKAGAADFLVKPFDKNTLHEKLRQFLPALAAS